MKYIAHRGLRMKNIQENSIVAFKNAIQNTKISGFEFDIRVTKDEKFVIHHNAFIKQDLIKKKTYRYLKNKYNLLLLSDVLKLNTNKIMLVEIKDSNIPYQKLINIFESFANKNIYCMSFHNEVINKLKECSCPIKLGILNYVLNSEYDYKLDFICLLNDLASKNLITNYQRKGIEVFLYGVLNEEKIRKNLSVYYIVDNIPKLKDDK